MRRTILIVDDLSANRRILSAMLRADYDILEAASGEEALETLRREHARVSAVLLDILMPGIDGYEVLRRIRNDSVFPLLPVIMITGSGEQETRLKSLALGANDFVMKPYSGEVLRHCLKNNIALWEASETVGILERDKLTGLWNREAFFQRAVQEIDQKPAGHYVLGCLDIEGFKVINDQYGIEMGNKVLRSIAGSLQRACEANGGLCWRIFADQFVGLYPKRLLSTDLIGPDPLEAQIFKDTGIRLTLSIGRYVIEDKHLSISAMFDRASIAKNTIKGRYDTHVAVYDEHMRDRIVREQKIVNEMNSALDGEQFEVWFQPQYNRSTDAMIGAEALVRWRHPESGLIPPGEFIPIFEQNGFIYQLDKFVWEKVCASLRRWLDEGRSPLPVSVNISRYDLLRPDLIGVIDGLIQKYALPRDLMRLEITESAFSQSAQRIVSVVKELIGLGYTVEIDDFGSGYSSLNTLKDVPAQIIKLDMRFLESTDDSQRGGSIVESVVRMAKWIGMSVIAEGVETVEQADYLRSIGCNYMQGYFYARPMTAAQYEAHCRGVGKEERLLTLETVENLDNNAFWDPKSMDTLIFNSYVGGASIYEYHGGRIELLRATEKFAQMLGGGMTVERALRLNWAEHLDKRSLRCLIKVLEKSIKTKKEVLSEYVLLDLPGCPHETHLRSTMRVIASAGDRHLVYCTNENVTAQRQAEQKARDAAEQIRTLMNDMPGGFARLRMHKDGSGRTEYANDGFCKMLGMTLSELLHTYRENLMVGVHPDDRAAVSAQIARAAAGDGLMNAKYRLQAKTGEYIWMQVFARFVAAENGDMTVNCYYANLSEAEKRALNLRETMPFILSAIMESSENLDFAKDKNFNYICCSPAFVRFARQKTEADIIGKSDYDLWTKEVADHFRSDDLRLFEGGESLVNFTEAIPSDDGVQHYAVTSKYILRDSAGEIIGLYGSGRDVTDTRAALDRLQLLTDSIPGGIASYTVSPDAIRITYYNDGFCKMLGCTRAEYEVHAEDHGVVSMIDPEDLPGLRAQLKELTARGTPLDCTCRCRRFDGGGPIWINLRGVLVGRHDDTAFINTVLYDVTSQREAERLEERLLDNLPCGAGIYTYKDGKARLIYQNKSYWGLVGLDGKAFPDSAPISAIHPDDVPVIIRELASAAEQGRDMQCDIRLHHPSEGYRSVRLAGRIVLRGPGDFLIYATFAPNDGVGLSYQQTLPLLLSTIMEASNDYAFAKDKDFRYICCSPAFLQLAGLKDESEVVGRTDYEIFPKDMAKPFRENDLALLRSGKPLVDFNETIYDADGAPHYCLASKHLLRDSLGAVIGIYGVSRDITKERGALEQLRISQEETNLAERLGGNIVMRYTVADKSLSLSPVVAAAHSLPERMEDVPYAPVRLGMIAPESVAAYVGFFEAILRGDETGTALYRQHVYGHWRWMESKSVTIFSDEGKPVKAIISLVDVTDQLEKETVYKKWQHSLEDRAPESYMLLRCNLNRDFSYDVREGLLIPASKENEGLSYRERSKLYAARRVHPDDREMYVAFSNPDSLLAGYYRGRRSSSLEYRELLTDGAFRWLRLSVDLVEYPNSTDVEAYLMYEDIDEAKRAELATKRLSETDSLTGLLNRATFAARVDRMLKDAAPNTRHALLMLDIDGFKQINDAFGHAAGDQALADIARDLRAAMRHDDLVARLGGDEFVVFLGNVVGDGAAAAKANRIRELARKTFGGTVHISASVGIAYAPDDGASFDALYRRADAALYHVKLAGRDGCAAYRDGMAAGRSVLPSDEG